MGIQMELPEVQTLVTNLFADCLDEERDAILEKLKIKSFESVKDRLVCKELRLRLPKVSLRG